MTALEPSSQPPRILTEVQRDEQRFDGMWMLRTNTESSAVEVALRYKQLWMVEQRLRTAKSLLDTRPVFHKTDAIICGHFFCSFEDEVEFVGGATRLENSRTIPITQITREDIHPAPPTGAVPQWSPWSL